MSFEIDLTNFNDDGFVTIPVGRYNVEANPKNWLYYVKQETGNPVILMGTTILDGEFKGEGLAYFATITDHSRSKANYLGALKAFGLLREGDRAQDGTLRTSLQFGEKDAKGKHPITAVVINGQARPIAGKAIAVVVPRDGDPTETSVKTFEAMPKSGSALGHTKIAEDDVPF